MREERDVQPRATAPRITTGIGGLDIILGGGLPPGHMYLLEGDSGAGKSTLGLQFLLAGKALGESCLWITMSETERELRETAASHGWDLGNMPILNLFVSQELLDPGEQYSFFAPSDVELSDTTRNIVAKVGQLRPTRIVFDPFSDVRHLARDTLGYRRQILALRDFFSGQGCTVLLIQELTRGSSGDAQAEALAHGYFTLHQESPDYGGQRRRLRIHKMRGISFRDGFHDFSIRTGGIELYPRLTGGEPQGEVEGETVSSGVAEIDALLGGGAERGSSVLLLGAAGVGKSTLATQFALAAAQRGEPVLFFLFDETLRAFRARSRRLGHPLTALLDAGMLRLRQVDTAEFSPGEFAQYAIDAVERHGVRVLVVDSLSGYLSAMPEERFLTAHLHDLLSFLSSRNVLTVLTLAQHGMMGERVQSPVDISYLADTVMLIRYFEAFGNVRRALSVMKKRSGPHESLIRELCIGGDPMIRLGAPLVEFHGVLTGTPVYTGSEPGLAGSDER